MPSQSDTILALIAVSGEVPLTAVRSLRITPSYLYKLMAGLKKDRLIKEYNKDGIKGYRMTSRGKNRLLRMNPERYSFFLQGETGRIHTELTRRLRLHRGAETVVIMSHAGVKLFPDEKPVLFGNHAVSQPPEAAFYFSREIKDIGIEHLKVRSSRAMGALFTENQILLMYNMGNTLMKWEYQTELRLKSLMNARFGRLGDTRLYSGDHTRGLMLGTDMDTALLLLRSDGGYRRSCIRLDGTFDRFYFIPNTPEGELQLRILISGSVTEQLRQLLISDMKPQDPGLIIEHDALTPEGLPVLLAFDFDMERLRRFHDGLQLFGRTGEVYCFEFQKPVLEDYLGSLVNIHTINTEKVERRFLKP